MKHFDIRSTGRTCDVTYKQLMCQVVWIANETSHPHDDRLDHYILYRSLTTEVLQLQWISLDRYLIVMVSLSWFRG